MSKYSKEFKEKQSACRMKSGTKRRQPNWDNKGNNRNTRERKPDKT